MARTSLINTFPLCQTICTKRQTNASWLMGEHGIGAEGAHVAILPVMITDHSSPLSCSCRPASYRSVRGTACPPLGQAPQTVLQTCWPSGSPPSLFLSLSLDKYPTQLLHLGSLHPSDPPPLRLEACIKAPGETFGCAQIVVCSGCLVSCGHSYHPF